MPTIKLGEPGALGLKGLQWRFLCDVGDMGGVRVGETLNPGDPMRFGEKASPRAGLKRVGLRGAGAFCPERVLFGVPLLRLKSGGPTSSGVGQYVLKACAFSFGLRQCFCSVMCRSRNNDNRVS